MRAGDTRTVAPCGKFAAPSSIVHSFRCFDQCLLIADLPSCNRSRSCKNRPLGSGDVVPFHAPDGAVFPLGVRPPVPLWLSAFWSAALPCRFGSRPFGVRHSRAALALALLECGTPGPLWPCSFPPPALARTYRPTVLFLSQPRHALPEPPKGKAADQRPAAKF